MERYEHQDDTLLSMILDKDSQTLYITVHKVGL